MYNKNVNKRLCGGWGEVPPLPGKCLTDESSKKPRGER